MCECICVYVYVVCMYCAVYMGAHVCAVNVEARS